MENSDITVFEALASNTINYGPYASESIGFNTKEQFIEEVGRRLPGHPKCVTYEKRIGEIIHPVHNNLGLDSGMGLWWTTYFHLYSF